MGRRKKGSPVHGWFVLDKPVNMTSTQAVGIIRRVFNAQKAGHSGTLDPLATGILPIALGEATKTVSFAVDGEKAYRFTVRWGAETETDDTEGAVAKISDLRPDRAGIEALLPQFHGEIMQVPPAYSAIKVDGARAYDLARDGETVVLEARPVFIDSLQLVDTPTPRRACSKRVAARERMCARSLATWVASSAATGTSSLCGGHESARSMKTSRLRWTS